MTDSEPNIDSLVLVGEQMVEVSNFPNIKTIPNTIHEPPTMNAQADGNQIGVEIEPDVKANSVYMHLCSCSFIINCFTRDTVTTN
jgi:hypothetical protein